MKMFSTIHVRLTLLNASVFSVLLLFLSILFYVWMQHVVFQPVDQSLDRTASHAIVTRSYENIADGARSQRTALPQLVNGLGSGSIGMVVWSPTHQLLEQEPHDSFTPSQLSTLHHHLTSKVPFSLRDGDQSWRVMDLSMASTRELGLPIGTTIQFVQTVTIQAQELHEFLLLLMSMVGIGIFTLIMAGWFLAQKAVAPIRLSWERQRQLIADASHELVKPLVSIQEEAQFLFRYPLHTVETEAERISMIDQKAEQITQLVEGLLTLARADSGQCELILQPINVSDMLADMEELIQVIGAQHGLNVEWAVQANVIVHGDEQRLRQLLWILVDHAILYTPNQGTVTISCVQDDVKTYVTVEDTGIGMDSFAVDHLFDRFYRDTRVGSCVDKTRTGLELAIGKWIVDAHRGQLTVTSSVGKGTTFVVSL
ncbi:sensor histidine kinase [Sulfoacidibacillus ferrooxidans]|uniref:histidine kinase n=1 Tax=Sulfoacidibacillus ferrooxidans TaxID=2005001 RepID=A0A9X1VF45_9BACL|nr:HAMP domain-containing sensor histidine kinase [Sulfoacidibacillus ferrooxidans]MCI0184867.1 Adaptive-response sensory-kinase SasA [Sulfoacidibacillus ferrooxidans]